MDTTDTNERKWHRRSIWVLLFFGLVLGLVSFPNHHQFRTYALDLGLYTHALWHYAHGSVADCALFLENEQSVLADHFDLYLPLLSPLVHVTGTWTLLLVQWFSVLFGAWGVRRLALASGLSPSAAFVGMLTMLLFFGVFGAMAFDYHSNVVAAMLLPWFLLALRLNSLKLSLLLFLLMLVGKETMGFWIGPIALLIATDSTLNRSQRALAGVLGVVGIGWSALIIGWVMPAHASDGAFAHFDYGILGKSAADVPSALLTRPLELFQALFADHINVDKGTAIKQEYWLMLMGAGGWALLMQWRLGLMALPIIAQKMWHDDPGKWSVIAHYGVELAPLVGIAVAQVVGGMRKRPARMIGWFAVVLSLSWTIRFMDRTIAYHDRSRIRIYQAQHYFKEYDVRAVKEALQMIPPDVAVSAQSPAVPHLALRDRVYQFPIVRDAQYLVFLPQESPYPLDAEAYADALAAYRSASDWDLVRETDGCIILKRVHSGR